MEQNKERPDPGIRGGLSYYYGVYGLSEWSVLIPIGNARLRVHFSGGSMSGYGRRPATFETKSREIAKAIENSCYFTSGRIKPLGMY